MRPEGSMPKRREGMVPNSFAFHLWEQSLIGLLALGGGGPDPEFRGTGRLASLAGTICWASPPSPHPRQSLEEQLRLTENGPESLSRISLQLRGVCLCVFVPLCVRVRCVCTRTCGGTVCSVYVCACVHMCSSRLLPARGPLDEGRAAGPLSELGGRFSWARPVSGSASLIPSLSRQQLSKLTEA